MKISISINYPSITSHCDQLWSSFRAICSHELPHSLNCYQTNAWILQCCHVCWTFRQNNVQWVRLQNLSPLPFFTSKEVLILPFSWFVLHLAHISCQHSHPYHLLPLLTLDTILLSWYHWQWDKSTKPDIRQSSVISVLHKMYPYYCYLKGLKRPEQVWSDIWHRPSVKIPWRLWRNLYIGCQKVGRSRHRSWWGKLKQEVR